MVYERFPRTVGKELFEFIKHGSKEHQDWLKEAIECFRMNWPKPEPRP